MLMFDKKYKCENYNLEDDNINKLEEILNSSSVSGYEFAGYVPTETNSSGKLFRIGLIFKRTD